MTRKDLRIGSYIRVRKTLNHAWYTGPKKKTFKQFSLGQGIESVIAMVSKIYEGDEELIDFVYTYGAGKQYLVEGVRIDGYARSQDFELLQY